MHKNKETTNTPRDTFRRCAVSRTPYAKSQMIRFCIAPDTTVTPDIKEKLPGRGIWVHCAYIKQAIQTNAFARSAKTPARIPDGLYTLTKDLLYGHIVELIHGAVRSGNAVWGFDTVKDALKNTAKNTALAIVFSSADQAADGHTKLQGMCRMLNIEFCTILDADTMGKIWYGTYAGIKKCGVATRIHNEIHRYGLFQNGDNK